MATPPAFPYPPMEARISGELPAGEGWQFEPKWDGFRCLAFRKGQDVRLQSKAGQPLERYFPEIVERVKRMKSGTFILDGELVVPDPAAKGTLSFDDLLQRIHPAETRIRKLAREFPAVLVAFDLLLDGKAVLVDRPLEERRARLEKFLAKEAVEGLFLSPATRDRAEAQRWLRGAGGGLDGVVAKRLGAAYATGSRDAMVKVKTRRTADCVVGGFRYATGEKSGPSRWSTERSSEWVPLDPVLVIEVEYDHFSQDRFRHGTKFLRWRPDKAPKQCTFEQVRGTPRSTAKWLRR